jgi:hypothetical protein
MFLSLAVIALVVAWVGSANALQISFIEPISPTESIAVSTDIVGASISTSPERADVVATLAGFVLPGVSVQVGLTEPGTGALSDLLRVDLSPNPSGGVLRASFFSDLTLDETGLPQLALSLSLGDLGSLTITTQSDLELAPVPEPSTLLLFGSSLAGFGVLWRRYRPS